jgi:hypothetical protein
MSGNIHPLTQRYILKALRPQLHRSESIKTHTEFTTVIQLETP